MPARNDTEIHGLFGISVASLSKESTCSAAYSVKLSLHCMTDVALGFAQVYCVFRVWNENARTYKLSTVCKE
jgi:hypothetical protein